MRCQPPHTAHSYGRVAAARPRGAFISAIDRASASLVYRSFVSHDAREGARGGPKATGGGAGARRLRRGIGALDGSVRP